MKLKSKVKGASLISPLSIVVICVILFTLALIENPLNWVSAYGWSGSISYDIVLVYLIALMLGVLIGHISVTCKRNEAEKFDFKIKYLWFLFAFAAFFSNCVNLLMLVIFHC